jgi:hypothetical protein
LDDTAVVGAPDGGRGSAYVFARNGVTWSQRKELTAADGEADDLFGSSVAISGETVAIGARGDNISTPFDHYDQGSAYVFSRSGSVWSKQAKLIASDGSSQDSFGGSVAICGDDVLVGVSHDDIDAAIDQGSAHAFLVPAPGRPTPRSPKGLVTSRTPTFTWAPAAKAATYEVCIYKGSSLIRKKTGITATSWKCTKRPPRGVRLTWKVRAWNAAGAGLWSARPWFKVR